MELPCPFCGKDKTCEHFIGWTETENGITIALRRMNSAFEPQTVQATDCVLTTGVSARVYRRTVSR